MKWIKILFFLIFILSFFQLSFSISLYDENIGEYVSYISNSNPTFKFNFSTTGRSIYINNTYIHLPNSTIRSLIDIDVMLNGSNSKWSQNFNLSDFDLDIETLNLLNSELYVGYNAIDLDDPNQEVFSTGMPNKLLVKYSLGGVELQSNSVFGRSDIFFLDENLKTNLIFNDKIVSYTLYQSDLENLIYFDSFKFKGGYVNDFSNVLTLNFDQIDINSNVSEFVIDVVDFYGVTTRIPFKISNIEQPLKINLITKKDNSNLDYYFDSNPKYINLFNKTLFYSKNKFDLVVETNKNAICYGSSSSLTGDFASFDDFKKGGLSLIKLTTVDGLIHTFKNFDPILNSIWVYCESSILKDDFSYLNYDLLNSYNYIKTQNYFSSMNIDFYYPGSKITQSNFKPVVRTNSKGICYYQLNSNPQVEMQSQNYFNHSYLSIDLDIGKHELTYWCYDRVYNTDKVSFTLEVDPNANAQILSPKSNEILYTNTVSSTFDIILSEDVSCYASKDLVNGSQKNSLTNELIGEGLERKLNVNGLNFGENFIYVYCKKNVGWYDDVNSFKIVYDNLAPSLSNFTFLNDDKDEVEYLGSYYDIDFKFDVDSLSPVERYYVSVLLKNGTYKKEFSSKPKSISSDDFEEARSISIIAENIFGRNSSAITKTLKFDFIEPILTISNLGNDLSINCVDTLSGCSKIYYGFSQTGIDCRTSFEYDINDTLNPRDQAYICAKAYDKAGNSFETQLTLVDLDSLNDNDFGDFNDSLYDDWDDYQQDSLDNVSGNLDSQEDFNYEDPFNSQNYSQDESDDSNGVIIAASIMILLASISGGSYYAYRKGYLDIQLEKFGVFKNENLNRNSDGLDNKVKNDLEINRINKNVPSSVAIPKSDYDSHFKKLNKFIDSTLNSSNEVFDSFKDSGKGRVKGYQDTLLKNKKSLDVSKEDFDDFYKNSKSSSKADSKKTLEKEAEEFEKYYKKRKINSASKKTEKKDNNKKKK